MPLRSIPSSAAARQGSGRLVSDAHEDDLRARLAARDERALAELVDLLSPWLLGLTQAMLHDAGEAEEVVMETFRVAWEKVPPPDQGPRGLVPWLLQVARNRAIDRLRARGRRIRLMDRMRTEVTDDPQAAGVAEPNEAALPGWHVHRSVHSALAALPGEQREAVHLAYFEGATHSEIAERLSIPIGTVKTRLRLAYGRLRESLASLKDWVK
jgi:RNA polymerase sigma-70 factor (ECF subfamily)